MTIRSETFDLVPDETNIDRLGNNRKNSYVAESKDLDRARRWPQPHLQ